MNAISCASCFCGSCSLAELEVVLKSDQRRDLISQTRIIHLEQDIETKQQTLNQVDLNAGSSVYDIETALLEFQVLEIDRRSRQRGEALATYSDLGRVDDA